MDVSSKILPKEYGLLHQLTVKDLPLEFIKHRKKHDMIKLKKNYNNNQKVVIKIKLNKSIVDNHEQIVHNDAEIKFDHDVIDIIIRNTTMKQIIKKGFFSYRAHYQIIIPQKLNIYIKVKLNNQFYKNSILPQLERFKAQKRKNERTEDIQRPLTPEDYRKKDMYEVDRDAYRYSPNSDGGRSRYEVLSGNFSGESRYRK